MKAPSCWPRVVPQRGRDLGGEHVGGDDAGGDGIFEVVADVGDAVGPAHDLALGRGRGRAAPGVVADAVERLEAEVERCEHDVGAPDGVVVPTVDVGRQGVLAGVAARAVPAVVPQRDGLGERDVQPEGAGDRRRHLGHLQGVGEAGALVVVGEDEHLGLAGQPPEGGGVEDAVPVALEAGSVGVGLLGQLAVAGALLPGGTGRQALGVGGLALLAADRPGHGDAGAGVGMSQADEPARGVPGHRGRPALRPLRHAGRGYRATSRALRRPAAGGVAARPMPRRPRRPGPRPGPATACTPDARRSGRRRPGPVRRRRRDRGRRGTRRRRRPARGLGARRTGARRRSGGGTAARPWGAA